MPISEPQRLALPRVVDLDAMDAVRETLIDGLHSGPVALEADAVERISTNALFMLLSAAETSKRSGHRFTISPVSIAMAGAIEKLGLTSAFAPVLKG